ncbi:MAG TPA: hypothetical protein VGY48_02565 [Vicinamibacterales bacterium]|nr:hypothetical protein [Vicinamibacterales bacterium]
MKAAAASSSMFLAALLAACGTPSAQRATPAEGTHATDARPAEPAARDVELPSGAIISVRLDRALSTVRNRAGDSFVAILDEPIAVDGAEVLPQGTRFTGHITTSRASGRLKGRAVLSLTLDAFDANGRHYPIHTSLKTRTTEAHKKRNLEIIGGGTGLGALVGGLTGGGKGAGIGAAVGAGAGTGVAAATGKQDVEIPAETLFQFSLKSAVKI